jgi:hypothetical protein
MRFFSVPFFYFKFYSPSLADSMSVSVNRRKYLSYYCLPGYENQIISQFDVSYFVRPTVEIQMLSFKISGEYDAIRRRHFSNINGPPTHFLLFTLNAQRERERERTCKEARQFEYFFYLLLSSWWCRDRTRRRIVTFTTPEIKGPNIIFAVER